VGKESEGEVQMASNMYEDTTSVNPLGGRCGHECKYCSTHTLRKTYPGCKIKYEGIYRLYPKELVKFKRNLGRVFVCGQNDLFERDVPDDIIKDILKATKDGCWRNEYMFQTKNPDRMVEYLIDHEELFPKYFAVGTTIESDSMDIRLSDAPWCGLRLEAMCRVYPGIKKYITIEPIVKFSSAWGFGDFIHRAHPDFVYVGADSKHNHLPEPSAQDVKALINQLETFTEVRIKKNLKRLLDGN
jgi:protein gp37